MTKDMRASFEAFETEDGRRPGAVTRNGDGYALIQTQANWAVWQQAWTRAISSIRAAGAELLQELIAADRIIKTFLKYMDTDQKWAAATELETISPEGATRHHERQAAIAKATGSEP